MSLDNLVESLGGSPIINSCLSQERLEVRILGLSRNVEVPGHRLLLANGNNLVIEGDLTRRTILCSLDAKVERPELREFASNPTDLIRKDRGLYVHAALTILRAYNVAGKPPQASPLGGFEGWSRLVRDALVWLGEADPVASMNEMRDHDPQRSVLQRVIAAWRTTFGSKWLTAKQLIAGTGDETTLVSFDNTDVFDAFTMALGDAKLTAQRLGIWLGSVSNRTVDGHRIVKQEDKHTKIALWSVQPV